MWWVSFKDWGVYLFHSIPMDSNKNILSDEAKKLGSPASHGCVRLNIDNAKWIYDNIPEGTPVNIYK
jgi:lipoprotein-anchoring transpeptidase ErfK/SrfK